jgi:DNA-binding GntR family transcriptional regulator
MNTAKTKTGTRYAELARHIMQDIAQQRLLAGANLPNEHALAKQYGVGRGTVRAALRIVQELGFVSRKKRAGTQVKPFRPPSEYSPSISSIEELTQYGEGAKRKVRFIREVVVDLELSTRLGMPPGTRWLHIGALRADPSTPTRSQCWSDIYVEAETGNKIRRLIRQTDELVHNLVQKSTGRVVVEVEQRIRAAGVPEPQAKELDTEPGAYALEITRSYLDQNGALMEVVVSLHPGDRFSYLTKLHRLKQPRTDLVG